jgi:hypothetical protein
MPSPSAGGGPCPLSQWLPQTLASGAEAFGKGLSPERPVSSGERPLVHPLVAGWVILVQVALPMLIGVALAHLQW